VKVRFLSHRVEHSFKEPKKTRHSSGMTLNR
jgi:hypothetical protein